MKNQHHILGQKNELKSKEERMEMKARKDKDARQVTVPKVEMK